MKVDPESTVDLSMQYQQARRLKAQGESGSKLEELVTQVQNPMQSRSLGFCSLLRGLFVCFGRKRFQVYDVNPPTATCLLPLQTERTQGKKTLVLDLDETLLHSTFEQTDDVDLVVRVKIEGNNYNVFVKIRPGLSEFLEEASKYYEIVLFTASMAKYADPVLDRIDKKRVISHRLFREHCVMHNGGYVKDLSRLGRDLSNIIIVDVSLYAELPRVLPLSPRERYPYPQLFQRRERQGARSPAATARGPEQGRGRHQLPVSVPQRTE
jgi:Dullard-like phosphatase family protein